MSGCLHLPWAILDHRKHSRVTWASWKRCSLGWALELTKIDPNIFGKSFVEVKRSTRLGNFQEGIVVSRLWGGFVSISTLYMIDQAAMDVFFTLENKRNLVPAVLAETFLTLDFASDIKRGNSGALLSCFSYRHVCIDNLDKHTYSSMVGVMSILDNSKHLRCEFQHWPRALKVAVSTDLKISPTRCLCGVLYWL